MKVQRLIAQLLSMAMLLMMVIPSAAFADELSVEELAEFALPVEEEAAPAEEQAEASDEIAPMTAEMPAVEEEAVEEDAGEYAVAVPALEPMGTTLTVALTDKKAKAEMNIDDKLQIRVNSGETGTFTSKKAKYATVDANGLVTAHAKGSAKIEFKPTEGKKRTLTIKINDPYEPKGISLSQGKAVTVNVGSTLQLGAVLTPATARSALTWKSGKAKVATVDGNGRVTAIAEGKTKITVKTANKKKATITVNVVDPYKPTGVTLAQGKAVTLTAGQTLQLGASLVPSTARTTLTWKSSKAKVATVDGNGKVTAIGKGKAKITVQASNNKKAKATITVTVDASVSSGPIELTKYENMNVRAILKDLGLSKSQKILGFGTRGILNGEEWKDSSITITEIRLFSNTPTKYCIYGVHIGMTKAEVENAMRSVRAIKDDEDGNELWYDVVIPKYYEDGEDRYDSLEIDFNKSGIVNYVGVEMFL